MPDTEYFASLPPEDLARELDGRVDKFRQWLLNTGRITRWRNAWNKYYGDTGSHSSSEIRSDGDQGELSLLMSNQYRSIIRQIITYTTKSKLAIEPATANTDAESQAAGILSKQYLEYINREKDIEGLLKQGLEISLIMDLAWLFTEQDYGRGPIKMMNPDTGKPVPRGDINCGVYNPLHVTIDHTINNPNQRDWQIKHELVNKFDLAAQFPEKRDEILSKNRAMDKDALYEIGELTESSTYGDDSAMIWRHTFYHKKTPAMTTGRFFQYLDAKTPLTNDYAPFQYEDLPGVRICPSEMIGSALGYSDCNSLSALQDVLDALLSSGVTNMTTFGTNNIWTKPNSNLTVRQLTDGMNHIESEDQPEILIMNKLPPEWFEMYKLTRSEMETNSGLNSVARGNTEGKDFSGSAMALLQSMAIEFNSGMQRSYNSAAEQVFNNILYITQNYGDDEIEALVAGNNKRYLVKKLKGSQLKPVRRVFMQQGNPFKDTTAGKMAMVEYLMKFPNAIKYPDQISQVLTTGNIDVVLEPQQKQNICIQDENERLSRGEKVQVVWTENHPAHLSEHLPVTWDVDTKVNNPQALVVTDEHINEHDRIWRELTINNPGMLAIIGIPPHPGVQIIPPGPPTLGPGGAQPSGPATQPTGENQAANLAVKVKEGNQPNQPQMPKNPLTGERPESAAMGGN